MLFGAMEKNNRMHKSVTLIISVDVKLCALVISY